MYLIANWKQNKSPSELEPWFKAVFESVNSKSSQGLEVIIAVPFPLLSEAKNILDNKYRLSNLKLAAQDISQYEDGPHTGEVGATQLKPYVKYVICGHSERRSTGETPDIVSQKVENTLRDGLTPIICFGNVDEFNSVASYKNSVLFAYEPPESISTSNVPGGPKPATVESLQTMQEQTGLDHYLYGGSVDNDSIQNYLSLEFINGFLVGSASLDPVKFSSIIEIIS